MPETTHSVTDPRQNSAYQAVVAEFDAAIKTAEVDHLSTIWKLGQLVNTFMRHADRGKYGDHSIQTLADDLRERGRDLGVQNLARYLYYAKQVADTYTLAQITEMVDLGYTRTHARMLLALKPEEREAVQAQMLDGRGRLVSTEATRQLILGVRRQTAGTSVESLGQEDDEEAETATSPEKADPKPLVGGETYVASEEGDGGQKETKPEDKKPEEKAPEKKKEEKPAAKPEKEKESYQIKGSPLKIVEKFDTKITRLTTDMADIFILVREVGKKGFDSDVVNTKYKQALMALNGDLKNLAQVIEKIRPVIDDELGK